MANISTLPYARLLGANTVIGMAQKVGLSAPPPAISLRNVLTLAGQQILPAAPVDLQPANGATGISNNPYLFFRDPGAGGPGAAFQFEYSLSQNNYLIDPSHSITGDVATGSPLAAPGIRWFSVLPPGQVTLEVASVNKNGKGPTSSSTFTVPAPPAPKPKPLVPPTISVSNSGSGDGASFVVTGSGFAPNKTVFVRVVDNGDPASVVSFTETSDAKGNLKATIPIACISGLALYFSATDDTPNPADKTGVLWSNTFDTTCP
jgi:hypothetical protein